MKQNEYVLIPEEQRQDSKKVLVIDDEAFILQFFEEVLKTLGDTLCVSFENPKEALEFAKIHNFDLIIVDNYMPEMTGINFISEIKGSEGPNKSGKFILCSANADMIEEENKGLENVTFLNKPITIGTFLANINNLLP